MLIALVFAITTGLAFQERTPTVTGAWSGTLIVKGGTETHEDSVHVVLKQNGETLTGTAGPDADRQYPIRKGKTTTTAGVLAVSFEVIAGGEHMAFDLKLDFLNGGQLKGSARIEGEDGQPHTAVVELKRAK